MQQHRALNRVKRLGFVRRTPGGDARTFAAAWRHDALRLIEHAGDAAPIARVHCVARDQNDRALHHGVSIEWFDGQAGLAAFDAACAEQPIPPHKSATVKSASPVLVAERFVSGDDDLIARWRGPRDSDKGRHPMLIGLIERKPELSRTEFAEYWWSRHRPLANALVPIELGPAAYVHNYVLEDQQCQWDGIGELYERSLDTARLRGQWFDSPAAAELIADEERFLVRATRQVFVCDQELITPIA